jgi:hypothetical protein
MVVFESGYLHEIDRIIRTLEIALGETWTRDPFDRLIVSHAKANGRAGRITRDELIAAHYPNTIW